MLLVTSTLLIVFAGVVLRTNGQSTPEAGTNAYFVKTPNSYVYRILYSPDDAPITLEDISARARELNATHPGNGIIQTSVPPPLPVHPDAENYIRTQANKSFLFDSSKPLPSKLVKMYSDLQEILNDIIQSRTTGSQKQFFGAPRHRMLRCQFVSDISTISPQTSFGGNEIDGNFEDDEVIHELSQAKDAIERILDKQRKLTATKIPLEREQRPAVTTPPAKTTKRPAPPTNKLTTVYRTTTQRPSTVIRTTYSTTRKPTTFHYTTPKEVVRPTTRKPSTNYYLSTNSPSQTTMRVPQLSSTTRRPTSLYSTTRKSQYSSTIRPTTRPFQFHTTTNFPATVIPERYTTSKVPTESAREVFVDPNFNQDTVYTDEKQPAVEEFGASPSPFPLNNDDTTGSFPQETPTTSTDGICPSTFLRYSEHHTSCRPSTCPVNQRGVSSIDKKTILDSHNNYRSYLALGYQSSMPSASDMMEMEWDDELAITAQAHADLCHFDHDCSSCRAIEKFPAVGQNLCLDQTTQENPTPDWTQCISRWYDEVVLFPNTSITPFQFYHPAGHFTQMVWSTSWKIGCGYTRFPSSTPPFKYDLLYTCNYGPAGNTDRGKMYEAGQACSKCPDGTQCTRSQFQGLCKAFSPKGPVFASSIPSDRDILLQCNFRDVSKEDCVSQVEPPKIFHHKTFFSDGYVEAVLRQGERATFTLQKLISPPTGRFCIAVEHVQGPNKAGDRFNAELVLTATNLDPADPFTSQSRLASNGEPQKQRFLLTADMYGTFSISLTFSVPKGAADQYVQIHQIVAYSGSCQN